MARKRVIKRTPEPEPPLPTIPKPRTPATTPPQVPSSPLEGLREQQAATTPTVTPAISSAFAGLIDRAKAYSPTFAGLGGAQPTRTSSYIQQYDPLQGYTPQRPGGGLGPIIYEAFGGAVPEGERMIPLATEAGDVTMNLLRTYGRNAAINTEVGRSLLPGSIRNNVAQLLPWYAWGYDSYQEMLRDLNYTEIPGTGAWVKNDPFEPATTAGGGVGTGGGGGGGGGYSTVLGGSARRNNPALINWRI